MRLWVDDGRLQYDAPEGAITEADHAQVPKVKVEILRLLTEPCACGSCSESDEPHSPRCRCRACTDEAAHVDAAYEAAEREAIQAEGCTPAEREALTTTKDTADAATTAAPTPADAGPPSEKPGPWSCVDPENRPEDLAILRAIDRLDREESTEVAESSCYGCGERDWWRARIGGHLACRRCHPPVPGAEALS
ncbi:MAG: hypothetical protein IT460_04160 [Planctomycetes bacterium]|nr:hypothetical protein [Planctomycetota bacterium]